MTWVLIRKNFRLIVLKYANFTNLGHLESILINFSAFLRKIIILLQKMHQKLLTQLKNRARQNRARQKFCRENRANRARFLSTRNRARFLS